MTDIYKITNLKKQNSKYAINRILIANTEY